MDNSNYFINDCYLLKINQYVNIDTIADFIKSAI
jgi:hypothetical protein